MVLYSTYIYIYLFIYGPYISIWVFKWLKCFWPDSICTLFVHCTFAARKKRGKLMEQQDPKSVKPGRSWWFLVPHGPARWNPLVSAKRSKRSKSRSRSPPKTDTNIIKPEKGCWHLLTHPNKITRYIKIPQLGTREWSLAWSPTIPNMYPSVFQGPMCWSKVIRRRFLVKTLLITAGISASSCSYNWICLKLWFHKWMVSHITLPKKKNMRGYTRTYRDIPHFWTAI